jgi:hypothetical protein
VVGHISNCESLLTCVCNQGQWAPVVGTGLAAIGSLYLLLATDLDNAKEEINSNASQHSNHSMHQVNTNIYTPSIRSMVTPIINDVPHSPSYDSNRSSGDTPVFHTISQPSPSHQPRRSWTTDTGNRRKVAQGLTAVADYLGTPALDRFDDSEFKHGKAVDFPEIPGEEHRNKALHRIRTQYNPTRDEDGNVTPLAREFSSHSRAPSINGSFVSGLGIEGVSMAPRSSSPHSIRSPLRSSPTGESANTSPIAERGSLERHVSGPSAYIGRPRHRRDTLEVPTQAHSSPTRRITPPQVKKSPAIVVSTDHVAGNTTYRPVFDEPDRMSTPPAP